MSFIIRLLNQDDTLHGNAKDYFRYFLEQKMVLKFSTISVAEYCVKGKSSELPLKNLQVLPFNFNHAVRSGEIMAILQMEKSVLADSKRVVVINDVKLFAQGDVETEIDGFVTSDSESKKMFDAVKKYRELTFSFIDIKTPCHETFVFLPLK